MINKITQEQADLLGLNKLRCDILVDEENMKKQANLNKILLNGVFMTREAAIAKYEAVKDTCDLYAKNTLIYRSCESPAWHSYDDFDKHEYQLRAKPLKQISWSSVPMGVAVQTVNKKLVCTFVGIAANGLISIYNTMAGADDYRPAKFELAPASEQEFIAVQANQTGKLIKHDLERAGFVVDLHESDEKYRITGLAEGYELK